jgi:hypothetical protein
MDHRHGRLGRYFADIPKDRERLFCLAWLRRADDWFLETFLRENATHDGNWVFLRLGRFCGDRQRGGCLGFRAIKHLGDLRFYHAGHTSGARF